MAIIITTISYGGGGEAHGRDARTRAPRDAAETRLERTRHGIVSPWHITTLSFLLLLILFGCQKVIKINKNKTKRQQHTKTGGLFFYDTRRKKLLHRRRYGIIIIERFVIRRRAETKRSAICGKIIRKLDSYTAAVYMRAVPK